MSAPSSARDELDAALQRVRDAATSDEPIGVRGVVQASWLRALEHDLDPDALPVPVEFGDAELREYRAAHPLAIALPAIHRLLIRHTFDAHLIVAIGDQNGRLLWVDGDRDLRRQAESMSFVEGANWSEQFAGTSAPGTALAIDSGVQIRGAEHFGRIVHPWSCTAVPVHDPATGRIIGVIDITGGDPAVEPATLPLLEATVAAVEAELQVRRLDALVDAERGAAVAPRSTPRAPVPATPVLRVLGRDTGIVEADGRELEVSARHAEVLTLLAWHREGLSAEALALALHGRGDAVATVRAELVRLRKVLEQAGLDDLAPLSRPYRLPRRIDLDAQRMLAFLDRGAHRVALGHCAGPLLPGSTAPGIESIRSEIAHRMRESMLSDASPDTLLAYARTDSAALDAEVWHAVLKLLPLDSPRRSSVVARLELIERELDS